MYAVLVNSLTVVIGALLGLVFGRFLTEKLTGAAMTGIGLCTLYIGISGSLKGENPLVIIVALVLGAIVGTLLDIDGFVKRLGDRLQSLTRNRYGKVAEGFVTASLLFCVGAMAVTGSIEAGIKAQYGTLYAKSALDFIAAIMLASTLGIGVAFSALSVLVYEGAIALLAIFIAPMLTASAINELACAGSLIIIALGLNLIGITKIKVADLLPAVLFAPLLSLLAGLF